MAGGIASLPLLAEIMAQPAPVWVQKQLKKPWKRTDFQPLPHSKTKGSCGNRNTFCGIALVRGGKPRAAREWAVSPQA